MGVLSLQCQVQKQVRSMTVPCVTKAWRSSGVALVVGLGPKHSIFGRDADKIAEVLECRGYDTTLCMDKCVQEHVIERAFGELHSKARPGCTCVIYIGAHADEDEDGQLR